MTLRGEPRWRLCCAVLSSRVASECFRRLNNNDSSQLRRLSASRAPLGDECVVPQSEDNRDFGSRLWNVAGFRRSAPCAHRLPQSRAAHEPDATTATTTAPQIRPPRPQDSPDFELSTGHGDLAVKSRPLPRSAIQRLSTAGCTRPASVPDTPRCSPDPIGVGGPARSKRRRPEPVRGEGNRTFDSALAHLSYRHDVLDVFPDGSTGRFGQGRCVL